jgi:acetyltransferase-like isoleucine patch superfamily enzyme
MATGGVSSRQWLRGQREYLESLVEHGFISHLSTRLKFKKWLQSHYLRLNLPKYKSFLKMQAALCFIAALNLFTRCIPFHAPRHLLLKLAGVRIAPGAVIHQGVSIMAKRRLSVGEGSIINRGTLIDNRSEVTIGRHVSIAHESRIYTTGHDCHAPDFGIQTRPVQIDDYAVLFAGAVIMPGVRIGRGAVVLPFSVVTKDVAPMTMVGGIPATFKSDRHSELKYRLDYSYWFAI